MDKNWLEKKYHLEKKPMEEIADIADCSQATIWFWMDRHDIDRRSRSMAGSINTGPPTVYTNDNGYERTQVFYESKPHILYIHRLAAVAWFGFDKVSGNQVHHKNGIPWDNRESNLQNLTTKEHNAIHAPEGACERWNR